MPYFHHGRSSQSRLAAWCRSSARWLIAVVLLLASGGLVASLAQARVEPLVIASPEMRHEFEVEVVRNDEDRANGLMFRRSMPQNRGMLFDFARDGEISMWMQNTYISLDMVFIRKDGVIARIAENAEPLSTRTIPSGEPVRAVLELNGGTARRLGLKAGHRVEHPVFAAR